MKKRTGFVSNSSSASFIIKWELADYSPEQDSLEKSAILLIDKYLIFRYSMGDNEDKNSIKPSDFKNLTEEELIEKIGSDNFDTPDELKRKVNTIKHIIDITHEENYGLYVTAFNTIMFNGPEDFGEIAKEMIFKLTLGNRFRFNHFIEDTS